MMKPTLAITFLTLFLSSCASGGINQPANVTVNSNTVSNSNKLPPAEFGIGNFQTKAGPRSGPLGPDLKDCSEGGYPEKWPSPWDAACAHIPASVFEAAMNRAH